MLPLITFLCLFVFYFFCRNERIYYLCLYDVVYILYAMADINGLLTKFCYVFKNNTMCKNNL